MKKLLKIFGILLLSTVLSLSILYFYVGGYVLGGFVRHKIKPVSEEFSNELIDACHVIMPENSVITEVSFQSLTGGMVQYYLIKVEGVDDPNEFVKVNENNYIKEFEEMGEKVNIIDGAYKLSDEFRLYPNTKYGPKFKGITVLYDDDNIYLSVESSHIYGRKISDVFYKYE